MPIEEQSWTCPVHGTEPDLDWLDAEGLLSADRRSMQSTPERWAELGTPPSADQGSAEDIEIIDSWTRTNYRIARAVLPTSAPQRARLIAIGSHAARGFTLKLELDGNTLPPGLKIPALDVPPGVILPPAWELYRGIESFRIQAELGERSGRALEHHQRLFAIGRVLTFAARARSLFEDGYPLTIEIPSSLAKLDVRPIERVALSWTQGSSADRRTLTVSEVTPQGSLAPIDPSSLSKSQPLLAQREQAGTWRYALLCESAQVALDIARERQDVLLTDRIGLERDRTIADELRDPKRLIPEGVDPDAIDLSLYGDRVLGFVDARPQNVPPPPPTTLEQGSWLPDERGNASDGVGEASVENDAPPPSTTSLDAVTPSGDPVQLEVADAEQARDLASRMQAASEGALLPFGDQHIPNTQPNRTRLVALIAEAEARGNRSSPVPTVQFPQEILDKHVKTRLLPHQIDGITWMWGHRQAGHSGVLLADDMGLGKTLQVLCFLAACESEKPTLVVCPVILMENWDAELKRHLSPLALRPLLLLHGNTLRALQDDARHLDTAEIERHKVVITSYETLGRHQVSLLKISWNVVVLDEGQNVKNPDTLAARAARGLKKDFGICATGTPVENRLFDLWALYDFLSPGVPFGDAAAFVGDFERKAVDESVESLRATLLYGTPDSTIIRREKRSELRDLPPKYEYIPSIEMSERQQALEHEAAKVADAKGIMAALAMLQMIYQHPRLAPGDESELSASEEDLIRESPKLGAVLTLLEDTAKRGEKVLVFTLWQRMQALLVRVLKHRFRLPAVHIINGDPKTRGRAHASIADFSNVPGFNVLVLSPRAAGTGLTITAANHVIHYGRWWNPAKEDQATDRAYRIGQKKDVHVYYPLLHRIGDPQAGFDVKLHNLVSSKRRMRQDFLRPLVDDVTGTEWAALGADSGGNS